jgi:hypothetical protein
MEQIWKLRQGFLYRNHSNIVLIRVVGTARWECLA